MPSIEEKMQFADFIETVCSISSFRNKLKSLYNYDLPCTDDEWRTQTHLYDLVDVDEIARYMHGGTHYVHPRDRMPNMPKCHKKRTNPILIILTLMIVIAVGLLAWFLIGRMEFDRNR